MRFLFKTTLVHLQKNLPIVSVLGFFVSAGSTVLSSVDNLSDNLNKGFKDINFDSNPHDLILVSRGFRPSQKLNIDPDYLIDLKHLKFEPGWGYKFAFKSTSTQPFIKSSDKSKVSGDSSGANAKVFRYGAKTLFLLFKENTSTSDKVYLNDKLKCSFGSQNPIPEIAKEFIFVDENQGAFNIPSNIRGSGNFSGLFVDDQKDLEGVDIFCKQNFLFKRKLSVVSGFFETLLWQFNNIISPTTNATTSSADANYANYKLNADELYELHGQNLAFNPYRLWKYTIDFTSNLIGVKPFVQTDFYLRTNIKFQNKLDGKDITNKFNDLIRRVKDSPVFYRLDTIVRNNLLNVESSPLLRDIPTRFYISSLANYLPEWNTWLPMVPGMDYRQTLIFLIKLVLWEYLNKNSDFSDITKSLEWNDEIKQKIKKTVETWSSKESSKGLDSWNPFAKLETAKENQEKEKPTSSQDYVFSVLRPEQTLQQLQQLQQPNIVRKYESKENSGGEYEASSQKESQKLVEHWKDLIANWIDGNYKHPSNTSASNLYPAFNRDSDNDYKAAQAANKNNDLKPFMKVDGQHRYYREYPDSFENVYKFIIDRFIKSIHDYLSYLQIQSLKAAKDFISNHDIFTFSFLLQNFHYSPSEDSSKRFSLNSFTNSFDKEFALSLNYHKSIVVVNPSNVSAKLNDSTKTGHSFKIITQETIDDSSLNRLRILSGNPIPKYSIDYEGLFNQLNLISANKNKDIHYPTYEIKDVFKTLARARYFNWDKNLNNFWNTFYKYYSAKTPDVWNQNLWVSSDETNILVKYINQLTEYLKSLKVQGSKMFFDFQNVEQINFSRIFPISNLVETVTSTGYVEQLSSYFALVSPSYAEANNITPISSKDYLRFQRIIEEDSISQEDWEKDFAAFILNPDNQNHIININGNKLIVTGIALSPDMLLPSHSWLNLIPNKEKEALVFVDRFGYRNLAHNSLSVWNEHYLSISYPEAIRQLNRENDYRIKLTKYMNDFLFDSPELEDSDNSEFAMKMVDDPSARDLVFLRSNYVQTFMGSVNLLSYALMSFVASVILFTVWILIKRYINSNLSTFGVFVANGISKKAIIFNSLSFIFIPTVIGVVLGYLASLVLQPLIFGLFSNIWYLTPVFNGFNISNLMNYMLIFIASLGSISILSSWIIVKNSAGDMMKMDISFKQNKFIAYIYELFRNTSPLWRFRISVILNTLTKGAVLSTATSFLFLFSTFLFNNFGQFANVSNMEINSKDYGFDFSFETPTDQSGQYLLRSYYNLGDTFFDKTNHTKKIIYKTDDGYDSEDVTFDKDTPELISSGIYSPYKIDALSSFLNQCKDKDYKWWIKKLEMLNADYPARLFAQAPYNIYMFNSDVELNGNQNGNMCSDDKALDSLLTKKEFLLPKPTADVHKMFYYSRKRDNASSDPKFNPNLSDDNVNDNLNLGNYIPTKNEDTKNNPEFEKFGNEPVFKPLIDYYKNKSDKSEFLPQSNKEQSKEKTGLSKYKDEATGDFITINDQKFPSLQRLFKDNSNYWLFSYNDLTDITQDPIFFKNRVILPILFNHHWTFNLFGKSITVNPWNEFRDFFSKYSPELIASMDDNYTNFVNALIHSRYGQYFVNRFMTKHENTSASDDISPGKLYLNKNTWKVSKSAMKRQTAINELLRENKHNYSETDITNKSEDVDVDEGLYWFNPAKIIYFWDKLNVLEETTNVDLKQSRSVDSTEMVKHPDRFIFFRPDFLYLIFAVFKDPVFLKHSVTPTKIVFGQIPYVSDYSKDVLDEFSYIGDVAKDSQQKLGLTSESTSIKESDYYKTPNGDQSYTYISGLIESPYLDDLKVIGIKQDDRGSYIKLFDKSGKLINHKLYESHGDDAYPVILNQFAAKKLGVRIGSKFSFVVKNSIDRYTNLMQNKSPDKTVTFKVIGVSESYYKTSIFVSQKNANKILGLNPDYGFNGLLTKKQTNKDIMPLQLTTAISGFSPSGLYVKANIHKSYPSFQTFLNSSPKLPDNLNLKDHKFMNPPNYEWFRLKSGIPSGPTFNNSENIATAMDRAYGPGLSIVSSINSIDNASLFNDFIFSTVSDLVVSVLNVFIAVFTPLLVCSLSIITTTIIEDLKNLLTILNLLGFTYVENSITILLYLGLVLGFSTIISLPISGSLLSSYVEGVFSTLNIFLPIYLRFDYVICSLLILLSIFGLAYFKVVKKLKKIYLPVAMKALNE